MLEAGLPALHGLRTLAGCAPGRFRTIAADLYTCVERGAPLHEALARHVGLLDPVELALIRVGEETGRLDRVLLDLAERRDAQHHVRRQLVTRLIYPAILLHVAVFVSALLAVLGPGGSLSAGIACLLRTLLPIYILGFGLYHGYRVRHRVPALGRAVDRVAYALPFVGRMVRRSCLIRFCQSFEALYTAGILHARALALAAGATGNCIFEHRLLRAVPWVANGVDLGDALQRTGAFDAETVSRLVTGVRSGRLEEALLGIRKQAELDARTTSERLTAIVPTVLYLAVVVWVAVFVILKFYLNYFAQIREALK